MNRLAGKKVLVAGGTGAVGEAIVEVFLAQGATVIVPSRSTTAIARLRDYLGPKANERLHTAIGQVGRIDEGQALRDEIEARLGPIDTVVASLGGSWEERLPLVDVPVETWDQYVGSNLTPHFVLAKTWLPVLAGRAGASYTLLGGMSAVMPIARYGVVSVNSAAQLMLARVLMDEMKDARVRINQVMCGLINTRARAAYAKPEWITALEVGEFCAYLASDEGAMVAGGVIQLGNRPPRAEVQARAHGASA